MPRYLELSLASSVSFDPADGGAKRPALACGAMCVTFGDAVTSRCSSRRRGVAAVAGDPAAGAVHADAPHAALIAALAAASGSTGAPAACARLADRVWEREWLRDFHAMRFGQRLWICPQHEQVDDPDAWSCGSIPGLAFGTGTHPSTALCLRVARRASRRLEARGHRLRLRLRRARDRGRSSSGARRVHASTSIPRRCSPRARMPRPTA